MRKIFGLYLLLVLFSGCIEEFDLKLDTIEPRLVVDGLITNKPGPYYIRLTESHTGKFIERDLSVIDSVEPVLDALIIISDNVNQIDTLVPIDVNIDEYKYDYHSGKYYKYLFDIYGNIIDTLFLQDPREFRHDRGFYKTQHLIGIPGRIYNLKIISKGKEYQARNYMPPVPDIDSLGYMKKIREKDGQEYYIPLLYFSEPQGIQNYYLIELENEVSYRSISYGFVWRFSIISDKFLQPYVNGLNVSLGATISNMEYPDYTEGSSIYVTLSSLTKDSYEFYKALLQQFKNDGGAYQPTPSSPPTNISNGGLGYFRASSMSEKTIEIPYTFH